MAALIWEITIRSPKTKFTPLSNWWRVVKVLTKIWISWFKIRLLWVINCRKWFVSRDKRLPNPRRKKCSEKKDSKSWMSFIKHKREIGLANNFKLPLNSRNIWSLLRKRSREITLQLNFLRKQQKWPVSRLLVRRKWTFSKRTLRIYLWAESNLRCHRQRRFRKSI